MKKTQKLLSLLLSLLLLVTMIPGQLISGVSAESAITYEQITDLADISAEKQYVIVGWRYFGGSDSDSTNGYIFNNDLTGTLRGATADEYATITYADGIIPDSAVWSIAASDEGYTLKNAATGKYLDSSLAASDEGYAFTIVSGTSGGYENFAIGTDSTCIRYSGTSGKFSMSGNTPASQVTGTNACNMTIYEVKGAAPAEPISYDYNQVSELADIDAEKQYVIVGWRYFGGSDSDSTNGYIFNNDLTGTLRGATADEYATITYADGIIPDSAVWSIAASGNGYSLKNAATGKYLDSSLAASDTAYGFTIVSGTSGGYKNFAIGTDSTCIRYSGSSGKFSMTGSTPASQVTGTNACNMTIYEVVPVFEGDDGDDDPNPDPDPDPEPDPDPTPLNSNQVMLFSDFQGTAAPSNLTKLVASAKADGATPGLAVCLGDYCDGSVYDDGDDTSPQLHDSRVTQLKEAVSGTWSDINYVLIQGNHDAKQHIGSGTIGNIDVTGAKGYDDFVLYTLNEDSFPWWQGGYGSYSNTAECKATVEATSEALETYLNGLIDKNYDKPVLIASHVPMHWSERSTNATSWHVDNIYANILFEVVNKAATKLDIVYLFGHNHSGTYDNYIGGTINYLTKANSIRIPNGTNGTKNYTTETLNFTYMNAGYCGSTNSALVPSYQSVSVFTIDEDTITIDRYGLNGKLDDYCRVITLNEYDQPAAAIQYTADKAGNRVTGTTEEFIVNCAGVEPISYNWTASGDGEAAIDDAAAKTVTVTYQKKGNVTLNCEIKYLDANSAEQSVTATYGPIEITRPENPAVTYAQVTDLSELNADDQYAIVGWRHFGGTNEDSTRGYVFNNDLTGDLRVITEDEYASVYFDSNDGSEFIPDSAMWSIVPSGDGYTIKNVATGSYLDSSLAAADEGYAFSIVSGKSGGYDNYAIGTASTCIRYSGTSNKFSMYNGSPASQVTGTNACNITIYKMVVADTDLAPSAAATASGEHTEWNQPVTKLNDPDYEPVNSAAQTFWNDWNLPGYNGEYTYSCVTYTWENYVKINSMAIYYGNDGAWADRLPKSIDIQYLNEAGEWVSAQVLDSEFMATQVPDEDNNFTLDTPIVSKAIRLMIERGNDGFCTLHKWRTYGTVAKAPAEPDPEPPVEDFLAEIISVGGLSPEEDCYVAQNEDVEVAIKTNPSVGKLVLVNENGKYVTSKEVGGDGDEDYLIKVIKFNVATKGIRTLNVYGMIDGELVDLEVDINLMVGYRKVESNPEIEKKLISVDTDAEAARANKPFTVTIKVSSTVEKVGIFNENGAGISKTLVSEETADGVTTLVYNMSVGSRGSRTFTVKMADYEGTWSEDSLTFTKTIKK